MSDKVIFVLLTLGGMIGFVSMIWLLRRLFRDGIRSIGRPFVFMIIGLLIAITGPVYNLWIQPIQVTAIVRETENETGQTVTDITLTGALPSEFEKLKGAKSVRIIQADRTAFTDDDWVILEGMKELEFISLNDTPVTDITLKRLVELPKLEKLYIARTKITADSVRVLVLERPGSTIQQLDVTGLGIPGKAIRDWKNADKTRKVNQ